MTNAVDTMTRVISLLSSVQCYLRNPQVLNVLPGLITHPEATFQIFPSGPED
jgi:hypothetical protein